MLIHIQTLIICQVPWLSVQDEAFPPRAPRQRRRVPRSRLATEPIIYPAPEPAVEAPAEGEVEPEEAVHEGEARDASAEQTTTETSTPLPSDAPSDAASTQPTTPSSAVLVPTTKAQQTPTQPKARLVGPILPAVPVLPPSPSAARRPHRDSTVSTQTKLSDSAEAGAEKAQPEVTSVENSENPRPAENAATVVSPPAPPKSWANLFRSSNTQASSVASAASDHASVASGTGKSETLSDVLNEISSIPEAPGKISFLKPRGLVNTGNMCYMNSVSPLMSTLTIRC